MNLYWALRSHQEQGFQVPLRSLRRITQRVYANTSAVSGLRFRALYQLDCWTACSLPACCNIHLTGLTRALLADVDKSISQINKLMTQKPFASSTMPWSGR